MVPPTYTLVLLLLICRCMTCRVSRPTSLAVAGWAWPESHVGKPTHSPACLIECGCVHPCSAAGMVTSHTVWDGVSPAACCVHECVKDLMATCSTHIVWAHRAHHRRCCCLQSWVANGST
ncbi:hypothetical protein V8C86DRAFT_418850 [Haematococcus lacustris]